jgi:hypothetical protein
VPTYAGFLTVQEELILQVMDTLERTGAAVALSSQSMVINGDHWVDPKVSASTRRPLESREDPGVSKRAGSDIPSGVVPRKG